VAMVEQQFGDGATLLPGGADDENISHGKAP
jgi:hypothetical protein